MQEWPCLLCRFVPDKDFDGTDRNRRRDGPVQFTRDVEEDLFGLDKFFKAAKKGEKRSAEESSSRRDYDSGKSGSKKRREWSLGLRNHILSWALFISQDAESPCWDGEISPI